MTRISVTPIQTGTVTIKTTQASARPGQSALGRKLDIALDSERMVVPILTFLIEHPEGRFLVDTGDSAINSRPGYLPWWNPFFQFEVIVRVAPHEEIGVQLAGMGLDPAKDIEAVLMSHLHHDHAGGLHHFPYNRILVHREHYEHALTFQGKLTGCLPQRWPPWFKPRLIELEGPPIGPFPNSYAVTQDGRVAFVPTPGHTPGHVSIVVRGDDVNHFIAADASYLETNIKNRVTDGITMVPEVAMKTLEAIDGFARSSPTIVLPTHDFDSIARAREGRVYATS